MVSFYELNIDREKLNKTFAQYQILVRRKIINWKVYSRQEPNPAVAAAKSKISLDTENTGTVIHHRSGQVIWFSRVKLHQL